MIRPGVSTNYGKEWICDFIKKNFNNRSEIIDFGAGSGTYKRLLGEDYTNVDAVDCWKPFYEDLSKLYRNVYIDDLRDFNFNKKYDLAIFGDVLEHLSVKDARSIIDKAKSNCKHILVGVPYCYKQGSLYGNDAEIHIQDDITFEIFKMRYPEFKFIFGRFDFYGYYYL